MDKKVKVINENDDDDVVCIFIYFFVYSEMFIQQFVSSA